MTLEDCRRFYAEEIRVIANLSRSPLTEAFARVPREHFLGPSPWQIASPDMATGEKGYLTTEDPQDLYHNVLVALDPKRQLNNGQPSALASWLNALDLREGDHAFHVGCGVGYYTAIMAEVVGTSGRVTAVELDPELAARARKNLASYAQAAVHEGDGAYFDPGPCDAIFINAGVTHPRTLWLDRLARNGRLVLPLTFPMDSFGQGVMLRIDCHQGDVWRTQVVSPVAIFLCATVCDPQLEPLLEKALKSRAMFNIKSLRRDRHEQTETCIVHGPQTCFSSIAFNAEPVLK